MWKDPTDVRRRKPSRLRGTPANKFVTILSTAFVGAFCLIFNWYGTTDAEWVQRARLRVYERIKPTEKEAVRRDVLTQSFYGAAVTTLNAKIADRPMAVPQDDDLTNDS